MFNDDNIILGKSLIMIFTILLVIVVLGVLCALIIKTRQLRKLKELYDLALKSGDKTKALAAGRKYYQSLRGYKELTALDELEIMKDISEMK